MRTNERAIPLGGTIRPARDEDVPAISRIFNAAVAEGGAAARLDAESPADRLAYLHAVDRVRYPLWVMERDGVVLGWLSHVPFRPRLGYAGCVEISFYVDPAARGQGVASGLVAKSIDEAADRGDHTLVGVLFGSNATSARLLARFGFEDWGRIPGAIRLPDRPPEDMLLLGRRV